MAKKMIIFILGLVVLFGALAYVVSYQNKLKTEGNPYGKSSLDQATIDQLDDPNYQNQILPDELSEKLENSEDVTVYFYSPTCSYCRETTPVVVPMTEELGVDLKKMNVLEFRDQWDKYKITGTPTIIHFENGEEAARINGAQEKEVFQTFFEEQVLGSAS